MIRIFLCVFAINMFFGCSNRSTKQTTISKYDLSEPIKFNMPESLLEISGITFHKGGNDTIYAVQDEQGRVFRLAWNEKRQYNAKFGKQGDYEDLAIIRDEVFVLKSNGLIFSFPLADAVYEEVDDVKEWKGLIPKEEYEGIWGDEDSGKLYVLCKKCSDDNSRDEVTGYLIQTGDSLYRAGTFSLDVKKIKSLAGKVKRGFRPSAVARNPLTSEWFIVSSVNKLLVVTDSSWNIKEACSLNGNIFNQPEGIAFDTEGNLYISNEGDDLSQGNILKFTRT